MCTLAPERFLCKSIDAQLLLAKHAARQRPACEVTWQRTRDHVIMSVVYNCNAVMHHSPKPSLLLAEARLLHL
jgi:hypothetical protein